MSDLKITQLPTLLNVDVNTTDVIPIVDVPNGITKKITIAQLDARWAGGGSGGGGGFVIYSVQSIASSGTIATHADVQQWLKVQGSSGPQTSASLPFTSAPADGTVVTLEGQDDTNYLVIPYNDADGGCINPNGGDIYLRKYSTVTYVYDATALRYKAIAGNGI